jgi:multiple antibiotic resistance protein
VAEFVLLFVSMFSIVNPFLAIPTFVDLAGQLPLGARRRIATQASVAVFVILTVSYFTGQGLLAFFGISVPSLRVAGGLVILALAWSMLSARISETKQTAEEVAEGAARTAIGVVPLAMPLLAGPGAISLMIISAGDATGSWSRIAAVLAAFVISILIWVILLAAGSIARALGRTGMNVATRFMGLILAAMAIEFITSGLAAIFPAWVGGVGA